MPAIHIQHVILTSLLQLLTTTALVIDIPSHISLSQDPNNNTTSNTPNLTDHYYVECERVSYPPQPGLTPTNCLLAAPIICDKLSALGPATIVTERWIWEELPGCALAYLLPLRYERQVEEIPSKEECVQDIYGAIIERCAFRSQFNGGSINVAQLPRGVDRGLPITVWYPRYAMAPKPL